MVSQVFIDHNLISLCLNAYLNNKADYVSNNSRVIWRNGQFKSQIVFKNLIEWRKVKKMRTHIAYKKESKIFSIINIVAPNGFLSKLGLTLDYYSDYILIKIISTLIK